MKLFIGLCVNCIYCRKVKSDKIISYVMCNLSKLNSKYDKYPRLPVYKCHGYVIKNTAND